MQKRGQVSIFIIVGIVLLAIILIILFTSGALIKKELSPEESKRLLNSQITPIQEHIRETTEEVSLPIIKLLAKQGGTLTPTDYTLYNGTKVQRLCYDPQGLTCTQRILTRTQMEQIISDSLRTQLTSNLNIGEFRSRKYELIPPNSMNVITTIDDNTIQINVQYPITLKKGDITATVPDTSTLLRLPLGRLHDTSIEILNSESITGDFEYVSYVVNNKGSVFIERHKPYPDEVYVLYPRDQTLVFQFAVEGTAQ